MVALVTDFGAVGDGLNDDTAAFQAAIAASPFVSVPPGRYRITGALQNGTDAWSLVSTHGSGVTTLVIDSNIDETIVFRGTSGAKAQDPLLAGFTFEEGQTRGRAAKLVYFLQCTRPRFFDLVFKEVASPLSLLECDQAVASDYWVTACRGTGLYLRNVTGFTGVNALHTGPAKAATPLTPIAGDVGLLIEGPSSGIHLAEMGFVSWWDCGLFREYVGSGYGPEWITLQRVGFDNGENHCLKVESAHGIQAFGCWFGYAGANGGNLTPGSAEVGIHISAKPHPDKPTEPTTQFIAFHDCIIFTARRQGVVVTGGAGINPKNISFVGCTFNANGSGVQPPTADHVRLSGVDGFTMTGCHFGTTVNNNTHVARACIGFVTSGGATNNNVQLVGNSWGNATYDFLGTMAPDTMIVDKKYAVIPLTTAADDAAAVTAGVREGGLYKTATGEVRVRV